MNRDTDSIRVNEDQQDHSHHEECRYLWRAKRCTLLAPSERSVAKIDIYGLPLRKPIALLATCRTIRREGTAELYRNVEVKGQTYICIVQDPLDARYYDVVAAWNTFRGEVPRNLLKNMVCNIEIMEGKRTRASKWLEGAPAMLKFLFSRVEHVTFLMTLDCLNQFDYSIRFLEQIANTLNKGGSVKTFLMSPTLSRKRPLEKQEE